MFRQKVPAGTFISQAQVQLGPDDRFVLLRIVKEQLHLTAGRAMNPIEVIEMCNGGINASCQMLRRLVTTGITLPDGSEHLAKLPPDGAGK